MTDEIQRIEVDAAHDGQRLDKFLCEAVAGLSRARVRTLLDEGQVRVDGRRQRKGDVVKQGAVVEIHGNAPPQDFDPLADDAAGLVVRYLDDAVAVVDKPAGQPTHPLRHDERGTLANQIIARFPETAGIGFHRREPGLLHRLDTDTSGLVVVARTAEAFTALRGASTEGRIEKRYLALVEGRVADEGTVDTARTRSASRPSPSTCGCGRAPRPTRRSRGTASRGRSVTSPCSRCRSSARFVTRCARTSR